MSCLFKKLKGNLMSILSINLQTTKQLFSIISALDKYNIQFIRAYKLLLSNIKDLHIPSNLLKQQSNMPKSSSMSIPEVLKRLCDAYPILSYEKALELFVSEGLCKKDDVSGKKKSKKAKKDPSAPKRPKNPYMFYLGDTRASVKEELGTEASVTDVTKAVALRWNALDDDSKVQYVKMAQDDKTRYEEEMKTYVPPGSETASVVSATE